MAIRINFITQFDNRELKRAQRELAGIGKSISRSFDVAIGASLAGAVVGLGNAIQSASNYAAEFEGVNQVFKDSAKSVQNFANTAAKTAGLSATEALQASKVFGLFATSAGLSTDQAANFSTTLVQLAGDLGSFNDVPTADALNAIQSGLQGQAEPLRKFGVFLDDAKLKAEAMSMKIYNGTGALSAQQKMLASYSLILQQTKIQQGDFVKYGDTFGNQVKTIQKSFEDLSAEIGQAFIPVLEQILPEVQALIPEIGQKLKAAIESIDFKAIIDGFLFIINNIDKIAVTVGTMWAISKAVSALDVAIKLAAVSSGILSGTLGATPWGAIALAMGAIAVVGYNIADAMHKAYLEIEGVKEATDYLTKNNALGGGTIGAGRAAQGGAFANRNSQLVKDFAAQQKVITDATSKATERFRENNKVVTTSTAGYDEYIKELKKLFAEQDKGAKQKEKDTAALKANAAALKASQAAQKANSEQRIKYWQGIKAAREALQAETDALNESKASITEATSALKSLSATQAEIGEFESKVVDSFGNIKSAIESAIDNKSLTAGQGNSLLEYLASTQTAIAAIAKQRDALAAKRSLVETLIGDVKGSLLGAGNLTNLLETTSKTVTKTVTSIVNGLQVAVSSTTEEITSGGLLANFKSVLAKTKAFADQLKQLRKLGLDQNLFKQIVDAGAEAGGAIAAEIIAGGADSVRELNGVYKDLADVSGQVAEQTAVVLYNDGKDVAGGLVAGLLAQEEALKSAAQQLADAFISTFNSMISKLVVPSMNFGGLNANGFAYTSDPMLGGTAESQFGTGTPWAKAVSNYAANNSAPVNITVNAGLVSSPEQVGSQINTALLAYKRANGEV